MVQEDEGILFNITLCQLGCRHKKPLNTKKPAFLPEKEESVFEKLEEKRIISEELFEKLREMKMFRNVLIHPYKQINNSLVYKNAVEKRQDFMDFKKEIISFLKKRR